VKTPPLLPLLLLLTGFTAAADELILTNGRKIGGQVEAETEETVTLRTPEGRIRYPRAAVKEILRGPVTAPPAPPSSSEPSAATPPGFEGTLAKADRLGKLRDRVVANKPRIEGMEEKLQQLRQREYDLSARMRTMVAQADQVNKLRGKEGVDRLRNEYMAVKAEYNRVDRALTEEAAFLASANNAWLIYDRELRAFTKEFNARKSEYLLQNREAASWPYFEKVDRKLLGFGVRFTADKPDYEKQGDHLVFQVRINGTPPIRLLLDTGASRVVLNAEAAQRVRARMLGTEHEAVIANGSVIKVKDAVLGRMVVGKSEATEVEAGVSQPEHAIPSCDGLLGMSFLRNFHMFLDPTTGGFELRKIEFPKEQKDVPKP